MRTLKKTLCLVLCLAMMVGLCAVGASATTFEDDADIKNKEEVDLLVGLGIINGYEKDNTFRPTKVLTRAEAAKIIAYLLLGADAADALPLADTQFTDVTAAHWASGYVGYCASMGVVEGIGNDKFDPSGTLTAAAWGKMLLCALGYDQYIEGMSGDSWDFNVTRLVTRTKLATGFAFSAATPMTRDDACLLAYNALTVPTVEYVNGVTVTTNDGTKVDVNAQKDYGETLAELNYNMVVNPAENYDTRYQFRGFAEEAMADGVITENGANSTEAGTTVLNDEDDYKIESDEALLGHYVRIYVDKQGNPVSLTEIGTTKTVAKAITAAKTLKKELGKAEDKLAAEAADAFCFEGGVASEGVDLYDEKDALKAPAGTYVFDDEGTLVAVIISDAEIWLDIVTAISTKEGEESITLTDKLVLQNNEDEDVVDAYEGIAVDDIVLVTMKGGENAKYVITKPEVKTGAISKVTSKGVITLDGAAVNPSATAGYAADVEDAVDFVADAEALSTAKATISAADMKAKTYDLYLDADGAYILCAVAAEEITAPDVFFWFSNVKKDTLKNDKIAYSVYATVVAADGTVSEKLVASADSDKDRNDEFATLEANKGKLVTFKTNKAGIEVGTEFADNAKANVYAKDFAAKAGFTAKATKVGDSYVNAATKFVFITANAKVPTTPDVTVKEGPTATDLAAQAIYSMDKNKNPVLSTVFVAGGFVEAKSVDASEIYYVAPGAKWTASSTDGYTYTVYDLVTGAAKEIVVAEELAGNDGFNYFTESKGITTLDYTVADDTDVFIGAKYTGRYENSIRIDAVDYTIDLDTSKAIIVDLRDDGNVNTVDKLAKAADDIVLDVLMDKVGGKTILAIFVRAAEKA